MDKLPEGLVGIRAGALGGTATYRIISRRNDKEENAASFPIPLNILNYCSTQRVATLVNKESISEEEMKELVLKVTAAEMDIAHMAMMESGLLGDPANRGICEVQNRRACRPVLTDRDVDQGRVGNLPENGQKG